MTSRQLAVLMGIALLVAGVVVGLMPVSRTGVSCGSAFRGNDNAITRDFENALLGGDAGLAATSACDSARSDRKLIAAVLLAPGGVLLLGAGFVRRRGPTRD